MLSLQQEAVTVQVSHHYRALITTRSEMLNSETFFERAVFKLLEQVDSRPAAVFLKKNGHAKWRGF